MSGRSENQATCYEFLGFDSWPVSESSFIAGQLIEGTFPWVGLSCWGCQVGGEFKQWPPIRFFGGLSPPALPPPFNCLDYLVLTISKLESLKFLPTYLITTCIHSPVKRPVFGFILFKAPVYLLARNKLWFLPSPR